jgi:hypothetical protein
MAGPNVAAPKAPQGEEFIGSGVEQAEEADVKVAEVEEKRVEQETKQEEVTEVDLEKKERERINLTKKERNELRAYVKNLNVMKQALINGKEDEAYKYCALALKILRTVFNDERLKLQDTQLAELDVRKELTIAQMEEAEGIRLMRGTMRRRKLLKSKHR